MNEMDVHREYVIERSLRAVRKDDRAWPESRRQSYLLLESSSVPLSIDQRVLPETSEDDGVEITFSVVIDGNSPSLLQGEGLGMDELVSPGLILLGYDVCDDAKTSAVTNFGRKEPERSRLVSQWTATLNTHHLFAELADATAFRELACRQYPEHAPFSVVGLYVVKAAAARMSGADVGGRAR